MATKITLRANNHYPAFDDGDERNDIRNAEFHAYCKGATEQREIDITKACEWILRNWWNYGNRHQFVQDFRKAMEE